MLRKYKSVIENGVKYEAVPPDGGWGYVVATATTVIYISTVVPFAGFGIIFKDYFASIGDETKGITLTNSIFNTVSFFMGLAANVLLLKISFRKVAILGSFLHIIGTCGTIFVSNLIQSIIFTGILQGMGFGLLLPSALSAFNEYFEKRLQLWMTISQTGMVIGYMLMPPAATYSMQYLGFKGSLVALMALSIFTLPAALSLKPVKMVKVEESYEMLEKQAQIEDSESASDEDNNEPIEEESQDTWHLILTSVSLLKDPKYVNICIGLALCFTADIAFYPVIPLVLSHINYSPSETATMMSVYFGADLVTRILLSLLSIFITYNSRKLFYCGAFFSIIFRTVWLTQKNFLVKTIIMGILGVFRAFIETLVSLVISEEYQSRFSSAFSLYMVANGITCLSCGALMNVVKSYTNSDVATCHVLTLAFLVSVISWTVEFKYCKNN
ncbi:monocarboxylate transporter 12-like [Rhynchophorus ferrugineus]|uniref:monocarboxylate transporter 12-like n=1 Tax=Rhynchophorus ferrugineus TaxID=354439 RepID=UPI003FCE4801